ncbi:MFS transporter [Acidiferrimicrobium sp. IK]|uniref:MFS transporter n=1 Tax=Acidiferrimicrobium sp. IK TaxID=2871700 RepID=UPI0021CB3353|nr:MFS transporter [Acidiferrimicrobium sp. IK]MCU4186400.1 MFS transporter [Acidiferrimicrobium sp. IK]
MHAVDPATPEGGVVAALDDAPLSRHHYRAAATAGVGFFTDAYDLFVVGAVLVILKAQWHLSTSQTSLVSAAALGAAFVGALIFGRIADVFGRKRFYGLEAAIMVVGAVGSALSPSLVWLIVFRCVLGIGIGGDYPVSAVVMSEYSNAKNRGRLVGMVFSMQAAGLVVGPLTGLVLLSVGFSHDMVWRLLFGLGALPAAGVIYLRRTLPESPRYQAAVRGRAEGDAERIVALSKVHVPAAAPGSLRPLPVRRLGVGDLVRSRRLLVTLIGTAGTWFIFDYAYYGNSISTPVILRDLAPHASLSVTLALTLGLFAVAAVPGYVLAVFTMDRVGHRRLQIIGFAVMAACFAVIAIVPGVTSAVAPFMVFYGISYFFAEFGPNTTTFVLSAELFPASIRTTAHGISSGIAKVGAFIGVFVFPILARTFGLRGTLALTGGLAVAGAALTLVLDEPARRSLSEMDLAASAVRGDASPGEDQADPGYARTAI